SQVVDTDWVQRDIATANRVLNPGGIRLELFLFIVSDSLPTDVTKDNVTAVQNDPVFHNYPDNLIVVYADSYYDGGGVSFNDGSGVVVYKWANTDNYQLLAHEVSHS